MSVHSVYVPTREEVAQISERPVSGMLARVSLALGAIGLVAFVLGAFINPDRVWRALLYNWLFFAGLSSAGVMFVASQRITTARWSRSTIRIVEGYVAFMPVAWVLLALIVLVGRHHVFPWANTPPTVREKAIWLGPVFFTARTLITFGLLTALQVWYIWTSVRLDVGILNEWGTSWGKGFRERMRRGFGDERRELHSTHSLQGKLAVWMALLFGYGWCSLAFDLSMTLDLHFQSTLYGWWHFMGALLCVLTSMAVLVRWWRNQLAIPHIITDVNLHDIGKLAFALTCFWGYLTFGQYLVIWYGNMGEETHFMRLRLIGAWLPATLVMVFLVFVFPFFGLMGKKPKIWSAIMVTIAIGSLVGMWLCRYLEVYPSLYGPTTLLPFGLWEIAVTLGMLGLWGVCYFAFMNTFPRLRVLLMTSPYRDEVQVPVNARTMEPIPAHE
ncbi:MAG: hypothetical protein HOQ09_00550 [Gemmatimonadaceae bacterium]|nr:hypothetical protein [Gemmatimonadaceae bacterium]